MKHLRSINIVIIILFPLILNAQKYTINGFVQDAASGEKLIGASVFDSNSGLGTTSNEYGFYSLTLTAGQIDFGVSYVGYTSYIESIELNEDMQIIVDLDPSIELEEVIVTTNRPRDIVKSSQMSTITLSPKQIKALPVFLGEADVFKALQLMPGVQSGTEGTSGMYVRGGGPDQNLILLDGVSIYNADHLFGFFSVFNPDAISNVTLTKGGFPARYGGRLSSVVDIRLKEGNMKEFSGSGSIGIISSRILLEGPIVKDKTSFLISARRTYLDILVRPVIRAVNNANGDNGTAGYYFYDANLKINHKFSNKDRIFLSAYSGRDKVTMRNEYDYINDDSIYTEQSDYGLYWGNVTSVLRWNHIYGNKFFSNVSLIYSNFKFDVFENFYSYVNDRKVSAYEFEYYSGIEDLGGIIDFDYYPNPNHSIKFGGKYLYHNFKPGVTAFSSTYETDSINMEFGNEIVNSSEFYIYAEDNIKIGKRLLVNLGLHYSAFLVQDEFYNSLQPRISSRFLITDNLSIKAAFTRMEQYIHLLTNSTIGLPTDIWLPTTKDIPPQESYQTAIGAAYNLNDEWSITIEGFYKTMSNLIEYKEGASFFEIGEDWENKVEIGDGLSYGAEFLVRRDAGKLTGWIGYTLAKTDRFFENQNDGEPFPYTYDRRHDISIVAMYKFSDRTDISATWVYGTGKALTLGVARYASFQEGGAHPFYYDYWREVEYYNGKNGFREPAYHRLDVALNRHKKKDWGEQTWSFGLYNAYNHLNPFYLYFGHENNSRVLKQVSIFPIIPSVSYAFNF